MGSSPITSTLLLWVFSVVRALREPCYLAAVHGVIPRPRPLVGALLAVAIAITAVAAVPSVPEAAAMTFDVTSIACEGPGSITDAMAAANANPGIDTIEFAPGLEVNATSCGISPSGQAATDYYAVRATQSVVIDGNGGSFSGAQLWIAVDGTPKPARCPTPPDYIVASVAPGLLQVGTPQQDNSAIEVTVRNLTVDNVSAGVAIREKATVNLERTTFHDDVDIVGCSRATIDAFEGANVNISDARLYDNATLKGSSTPFVWDGAIVYGPVAGQLDMKRTLFDANGSSGDGAIQWGGTANIVSTTVVRSNGINLVGGTMDIVNSVVQLGDDPANYNRIQAFSGTMNFIASTVSILDPLRCESCYWTDGAPFGTYPGASVNFTQSAVGVGVTTAAASGETAKVLGGTGTYTADSNTWIQPIADQDASALETLTGQPGLLTDAPGLPTGPTVSDSTYPSSVTPLLGTVPTPGVLIDVIASSDCPSGANKLVNPIDGSCIDKDVLGNPRWDEGNLSRNIGAVQVTLSPHLAVAATGDGSVDLTWNQPKDPSSGAITGYQVRYRAVGSATWSGEVSVAGPTTLATRVTGLTNGTRYEFQVSGVNQTGPGPESNTVTATPSTVPGKPQLVAVPGVQQVALAWTTPPDGGSAIIGYVIRYRPAGTSIWQIAPQPITNSAVITGLPAGTTYEFQVGAVNDNDIGEPSDLTPATPASAPEDLVVRFTG